MVQTKSTLASNSHLSWTHLLHSFLPPFLSPSPHRLLQPPPECPADLACIKPNHREASDYRFLGVFRLWEVLRASRGVWLVLSGLALRIPDWGPSDRLPSLTLLFEVRGPKATSLATALRVGLVVLSKSSPATIAALTCSCRARYPRFLAIRLTLISTVLNLNDPPGLLQHYRVSVSNSNYLRVTLLRCRASVAYASSSASLTSPRVRPTYAPPFQTFLSPPTSPYPTGTTSPRAVPVGSSTSRNQRLSLKGLS
jgi:hypothetical protein